MDSFSSVSVIFTSIRHFEKSKGLEVVNSAFWVFWCCSQCCVVCVCLFFKNICCNLLWEVSYVSSSLSFGNLVSSFLCAGCCRLTHVCPSQCHQSNMSPYGCQVQFSCFWLSLHLSLFPFLSVGDLLCFVTVIVLCDLCSVLLSLSRYVYFTPAVFHVSTPSSVYLVPVSLCAFSECIVLFQSLFICWCLVDWWAIKG